jgi:hypothetical protein
MFVFDIVPHIRDLANERGGEDTVLLKTYFNLPLRRNVAPRPWKRSKEQAYVGHGYILGISDATLEAEVADLILSAGLLGTDCKALEQGADGSSCCGMQRPGLEACRALLKLHGDCLPDWMIDSSWLAEQVVGVSS